jgi:hypothetical protein
MPVARAPPLVQKQNEIPFLLDTLDRLWVDRVDKNIDWEEYVANSLSHLPWHRYGGQSMVVKMSLRRQSRWLHVLALARRLGGGDGVPASVALQVASASL